MESVQTEDIAQAVFRAIDEAGIETAAGGELEKSLATPLFGQNGALDSIGLVHLIVAVEQEIGDQLGVEIVLADERAMSRRNSPFANVKTLVDYIHEIIPGEFGG
jgi:acyl carrier protein